MRLYTSYNPWTQESYDLPFRKRHKKYSKDGVYELFREKNAQAIDFLQFKQMPSELHISALLIV